MNNGADKRIQLIPRADSLHLERRWRAIITNSVNIETFISSYPPKHLQLVKKKKEKKNNKKQFQVKNLVQILAS